MEKTTLQLPLRRRPRHGGHPRVGQQKVPPLAGLRGGLLVDHLHGRAAFARGVRPRRDVEVRHGGVARGLRRDRCRHGPAVPGDGQELPRAVGRRAIGVHGPVLRLVPEAAEQGREGEEEDQGHCCCPRWIPSQEDDEGCCRDDDARVKKEKCREGDNNLIVGERGRERERP